MVCSFDISFGTISLLIFTFCHVYLFFISHFAFDEIFCLFVFQFPVIAQFLLLVIFCLHVAYTKTFSSQPVIPLVSRLHFMSYQ